MLGFIIGLVLGLVPAGYLALVLAERMSELDKGRGASSIIRTTAEILSCLSGCATPTTRR